MAKDLNITLLFDFYRNMLTDKQVDVIDLYYNEDLSLAEISEHLGITRQGVRDNITRAEGIMLEAEEQLGLVKRYSTVRRVKASINQELAAISTRENLSAVPWLEPYLKRIKSLINQIED